MRGLWAAAALACSAGSVEAAFELILPDPPAQPAPAEAPSAAAGAPPGPACSSVWVRAGDTLAVIAGRELGDASRWREIQALNGITDPRRVPAGAMLALPCPEGGRRPAAAVPVTRAEASDGQRAESRREAGGEPDCSAVTRLGDSLSAMAERELGDASRWPEIQALNHIREPDSIGPGWTLEIPCPGTAARDPRDPPEPVPPPMPAPAETAAMIGDGTEQKDEKDAPPASVGEALLSIPQTACHTQVAKGDTLALIAGRELGDASRWPEIARMNGIGNPDRIEAGQRLALPCPDSATGVAELEAAPEPQAAETAEAGDEKPVWRAAPGEMLDDVISGWSLQAGWTPIILERWEWRLDRPFQHRGGFLEAVKELLSGFPKTGEAPGVTVYQNKVILLAYR